MLSKTLLSVVAVGGFALVAVPHEANAGRRGQTACAVCAWNAARPAVQWGGSMLMRSAPGAWHAGRNAVRQYYVPQNRYVYPAPQYRMHGTTPYMIRR